MNECAERNTVLPVLLDILNPVAVRRDRVPPRELVREYQLHVPEPVPDFELTVYQPESNSFGKISLAEQKQQGKWTILFFYPADFTFV